MEEGEIISGPRSHNLEYDAGYKEIFKDLEKLYFSESDISAAETGLFAMTINKSSFSIIGTTITCRPLKVSEK